MTPEERQLLTGLFDRIRQQADAPRDREAEAMIADELRAAPYAPYLLAQTVLVQDHALRAASDKLQQLEARIHELESSQQQQPQQQPQSGSFLGNIGRSLFGEPQGASQTAPHPAAPPSGPWGPSGAPPSRPQSPAWSAAPPPPSPTWGQAPGSSPTPWGAPQASSGGFMKGALGAAAGVAGGVLLADSIRGLFSGGGRNPYGIASGFGGGSEAPTEVVNNYYESPADQQGASQQADYQPDDYPSDDNSGVQNADYDDSSDWSDNGSGGDDSYDV